MMKCIVNFYDNSKRAIMESQMTEKKISWAVISVHLDDEYNELSRMKFQDPMMDKEEMQQYFDKLCEEMDSKFRDLVHAG